jgi:hypothetical protein
VPAGLRAYALQVGPIAKRVDHTSAHLSLTLPVGRARAKAVRRLIKAAKGQLPEEGPGAAFLEVGGAEDLQEAVSAVLEETAHESVCWVGLWEGGSPRAAIWRNDQPFDGNLVA